MTPAPQPPARIWIDPKLPEYASKRWNDSEVEYVRADLAAPSPAPAAPLVWTKDWDVPVEKRRNFASREEWEKQARAEFMASLDSALRPFGAEIKPEVNGNATADIEITIDEYIALNGEPSYGYLTINLGSWYQAPEQPEGGGNP